MADVKRNKATATDCSALVVDDKRPAAPGREHAGQVAAEQADPAPTAIDDGSVDRALEMTFPASDPPSWMAAGGRSTKEE